MAAAFQAALPQGQITEKEKSLWEFVLSAYGDTEFSTKHLEKDFGNAIMQSPMGADYGVGPHAIVSYAENTLNWKATYKLCSHFPSEVHGNYYLANKNAL